MPLGMAKEYVSGSGAEADSPRFPGVFLAGQPPSMEWMTIHLELLVAGVSVVRDTWHDPPPWTAWPVKESFCEAPMAILVTVPPVLVVDLHGKSDPSGARGLLSGLPYGGGVAMTMWPWAVAARRATAEAARAVMGWYMVGFWWFVG